MRTESSLESGLLFSNYVSGECLMAPNVFMSKGTPAKAMRLTDAVATRTGVVQIDTTMITQTRTSHLHAQL